MSDQRSTQEHDAAERLAAALRRIAVAVERRPPQPAPDASASLPMVAGNLDALIARLRAVLDEMSSVPRAGDDS